MSFPFLVFKCGHKFHQLCLSFNRKDRNLVKCSKCKEKISKIYENIKINDSYYNSINTHETFEKELNRNNNKINFIHTLYSKVPFYLGAIKEDELEKTQNMEKLDKK